MIRTTESSKQKGRAITTLPVVLFNEYHEYKQKKKPSTYRQKHIVALRELRRIASDRGEWARLAKGVCEIFKKEKTLDTEA